MKKRVITYLFIFLLSFFINQNSVSAQEFIRGDADGNGAPDLTDAIKILNWLFLGDTEPTCLDSADADDSGIIGLTDAVFLLNYLFSGGPAPPSPFPDPGIDSTPDELISCTTLIETSSIPITQDNEESIYNYEPHKLGNWIFWRQGRETFHCNLNRNGQDGGCNAEDMKFPTSDFTFIDETHGYSKRGIWRCPINADPNAISLECAGEREYFRDETWTREYRALDAIHNSFIFIPGRFRDMNRGDIGAVFICNPDIGAGEGGCNAETINFLEIQNQREPILLEISDNKLFISTKRMYEADDIIFFFCELSGDSSTEIIRNCEETLTQIVGTIPNHAEPNLNGDVIVWHQFINGKPEIMMCRISLTGSRGGCGVDDEKLQITFNSQEPKIFPQIQDDIIIWQTWIGSKQIIEYCDINNNGQLTGCLSSDEKYKIILDQDASYPYIKENVILFAKQQGFISNIHMISI